MTVRVVRALPGGRAVVVHNRPSTGQEHRLRIQLRANATHVFAYCPLCDAWTAYPRAGGDDQAQRVAAAVAAGQLVALAVPDDGAPLGADLDTGPLAWARADGYAQVLIPAVVPPANSAAAVAARRALRDQLRAAHRDAAP